MPCSPKEPNRRVLALDDEADVLDVVKALVESLGWEVTAVTTPEAAFRALEERPYFLILSDIAMPRMDGYEFLNAVLERGVSSQLVFMTGFGYDPNHTLVKIRRGRHYPCLFKPFNRAKVAETVRAAYEAYTRGPAESGSGARP
jgi:CheY-like chemotaxis protein